MSQSSFVNLDGDGFITKAGSEGTLYCIVYRTEIAADPWAILTYQTASNRTLIEVHFVSLSLSTEAMSVVCGVDYTITRVSGQCG